MQSDVHFKLLRVLEANPSLTQRDLARTLGISLGKANYCLRALIRKGWVKAANFKNSDNKSAYVYLLTPRGVEEKAALTIQFLKQKMDEYEALKIEIRQMQREVRALAETQPSNQSNATQGATHRPGVAQSAGK